MLFSRIKSPFWVLISVLLAACGGSGSEDGSNQSTTGNNTDQMTTTVLTGSVGDGPIVGAVVTIYDNAGNILSTTSSSSSANYQLNVRTGKKSFPLTLDADGGNDIISNSPPDFPLLSVAVTPADKKHINVNPYSTFIVTLAALLPGGLNDENMATATNRILQGLNCGLDTALVSDPISTELDETNIANFIKATEVLGETVRRTRSELSRQAISMSAEQLVKTIATDLVDGIVDGQGFVPGNARIAATWNLVSAEVGLEAMVNHLRVNNTDAASLMDNAIAIVAPNAAATTNTANVTINEALINSVKASAQAAQVIYSDNSLTTLINSLDKVSPESLPTQVESMLPVNAGSIARSAIDLLAGATTTELNQINTIVSEGGTTTGNENTPPTISGAPATSIMANNTYNLTVNAVDADGDNLSFAISNLPSWANFVDNGNNTATVSGTPSDSDTGTYSNISIRVSDGQATASLNAFSITVTTQPNTPPTISGTPPTSVIENNTFSFTPTANDADGDALTYRVTNLPGWASFNTTTGGLLGTPGNADIGTYSNIIISVSDGKATVSLSGFSITVTAMPVANHSPTIGGTPSTSIIENSTYNFTPSANDSDGDTLTFAISNQPAWCSFNPATGALSGTPDSSNVGTFSNIVISVSDGMATASLNAFSITVTALPNTPPTINGTPATSVVENSTYSFRPTGADADGDTLVYSISNRPGWASFNTATGTLSGTPANGDIGIYSNVVISVSDGEATVALPTFSIEVTALPSLGSTTINWTPPTEYTDNSPLTNIAEYRIYYGTSSDYFPEVINVSAGLTSYVVENLTSGTTYYFVMTTLDADGRESNYSNVVVRSIP